MCQKPLGKVHYLRDGAAYYGGSQIGRPAKGGGRAKLDDLLRGGRAKLDDPLGGAKNFGLGQSPYYKNQIFFMFL